MKKVSTKMLVEAGVLIGMAQVLSYLKVFQLPNGGSITAGCMVPIILFAIRWGVSSGLMAGVVFGILQFLLGATFSLHPLSILLDYVFAFGALGLAGMFRGKLTGALLSTTLAVFARFVCHVVSGVVVFAAYAPAGMNPWIYSIVYNGSYLLPEFIISFVLVGVLYNPVIKKLNKI